MNVRQTKLSSFLIVVSLNPTVPTKTFPHSSILNESSAIQSRDIAMLDWEEIVSRGDGWRKALSRRLAAVA